MFNYHINKSDLEDKKLLQSLKDKIVKDISVSGEDMTITFTDGTKLTVGAFTSERPYCEPEGCLSVAVSSRKKINNRKW